MIDPPPETHRLTPDHLPTPFSADQIRLAAAPGTRVAFRLDQAEESAYVDRREFLPGPPIVLETRVEDSIVFRMELVEIA